LASWRALIGWFSVALVTIIASFVPVAAATPANLQRVVDTLIEDASAFGSFHPCPTLDDRLCEHPEAVAITVIDLDTGEIASVNGEVLMPAASSVKAIWVAAAVRDVGVDAVAPFQRAIFVDSSNAAAGQVIDLLGPKCHGGIDRVNTIVAVDFELASTFVPAWYDCRRASATMPRWAAGWGASYTTTNDLATFWMRLAGGGLLGTADTATVMDWAAADRSPIDEILIPRLPPGTEISHKSGVKSSVEVRIDGGVITAPDGSRFAIAIALQAPWGTYVGGSRRWSAYAACVITFAVMATAHGCGRPGDPTTLTTIDTGPSRPARRHQPWVI